jgi:hypothetical protein
MAKSNKACFKRDNISPKMRKDLELLDLFIVLTTVVLFEQVRLLYTYSTISENHCNVWVCPYNCLCK